MITAMPTLLRIPLEELHESKHNPRTVFPEQELQELANSLRASGQLDPLLVRPSQNGKGGYEIAAGACRRRAAPLAGFTHLDAIVRDLDDATFVEIVNVENRQRNNLNAMDEARGFVDWMKTAGLKIPDIAGRIGLSEKYVYDRVKLLQLIPALQELLVNGTITPGHGIILARISKEDQERALKGHSGNGVIDGLFEHEDTDVPGLKLGDKRKPVSVRELQTWVDDNVRFVPEAVDLPNLFPETKAQLEVAQEEELKVVKITRDYRVPEDAKDAKERTYGSASWKRADGQSETGWDGRKVGGKPCDQAVMGVVVAGPGRGEAFRVCVAKKTCDVHWKTERAEAAKARGNTGGGAANYAKQQEKWELERKEREAEAARWKKALPSLIQAAAEKLSTAVAGMDGPLAKLLLQRYARSCAAKWFVPKGKAAEDLVRLMAWQHLSEDAFNEWRAPSAAPRELKLLGIDAQAIVDRVAPKQKPAAQVAAKGQAKGKKLAGDVRRAKKKAKAGR